MFSNIKTSEENKARVTELTNKLQLGAENVIARLAFSYSLSKEVKLELSEIKDSKGKEYSSKVLFGNLRPYYVALICQHYGIYKSNSEVAKYLKLHIDHGLELIYTEFQDNPNLVGTDLLLGWISEGLEVIQ